MARSSSSRGESTRRSMQGRKAPPDPLDLWLEFQTSRSDELRNELVMHYLHLVAPLARQKANALGGRVEEAELFNAGAVGLMEAVCAFDLGRGLQFATYAPRRIR